MRCTLVFIGLSAVVLAGCDDECPSMRRCDLRERSCQQAVMSAVACLRGGRAGPLPRVSVISPEEFIARVDSYGDDDPEARAEAEAHYALWSRGLALFALAPDDYARDDALADSAAQTAAAYFPDEGDIVIIDRNESLADDGALEIFAHEVVHALQDQEIDLRAYQQRWSTSFDAALALDAIIEGEAVHYQVLAALQLEGRSPDELRWQQLYTQWRIETLRAADADPAPVALASMRFPYAFGGGYVSQHWLARGRGGIDALFEAPPRTTSEVLFGTDARELEAARSLLAERAVPELPDPYAEVTATALGAWIARMYAARQELPVHDMLSPARELAADVFSVHHDAQSDAVVGAWRVRMRQDGSAQTWPGDGTPTLLRRVDPGQREASLLAVDTQLPVGADMLAWRAPSGSDDGEAGAAAGIAAWRPDFRGGWHRACAVRQVPW